MTTKLCKKCGRTLEISKFGNDKSQADGHAVYCKECKNTAQKERYYRIKAQKSMHIPQTSQPSTPKKLDLGTETNPELKGFSNRDLMNELHARGWRGKMQYTYTIEI